jgi:hypothetical protein
MMMNLFKPFTVKFLYRLGGTDFQVSLLNALPGLIAVITTIPGILLINNTINKKKVMFKFFLTSRLFLLLFAIIPLMVKEYQPLIFVILIALKHFPESVSLTSLQSFTGDIFPENKRATAISLKNKYSVLAQGLVVTLLFFILRYFRDKQAFMMTIYQVFFISAFLLGMIEIYSFTKLKKDNRISNSNDITYKNNKNNISSFWKSFFQTPSIINKTLKDKAYTNFIICSLIFHFGWQMGWPLFATYQIKYLGADELWLAVLSLISSFVMFFSYRFWNKIIDKKGNSSIISIATLGMSATPLLFALSPNLYFLASATIITGFFTSGTITVILNSLLEVTHEKNRIFYVGVHVTLTSITLCISPILGNALHKYFSIYIALLTSALFRLLGSIAFFMRNKKQKSSY